MNRRFLLHCVVASSNAALDVLLKNAVIVFAAFHGDFDADALSLIAALSWGLFMAPFFLFSAWGGYLGDHFDHRAVSLLLRGADVLLATGAAYGFADHNMPLLLALVFLKGISSTLYSPIKYSRVALLLPGTGHGFGFALLESASMIAILGATYLAAMVGTMPETYGIGGMLILVAVISLSATWGSSNAGKRPPVTVERRGYRSTFQILRRVAEHRETLAAIVALSWFWALGAVYLSSVSGLVRDTLHGNENLIAIILVIFTAGVSLGLGGGAWINRGRFAHYLPLGMAALIAAGGTDLMISIPHTTARMLGDFFCVALASGIYASHFSAYLYRDAHRDESSNLFAANNIASALTMVVALSLCATILHFQVPVATCLACFAMATLPITVFVGVLARHTHSTLPDTAGSTEKNLL